MTPNHSSDKSKSLKTFFIYAFIVLFLIIISLITKAFFLLQQGRFDGTHQFILSVAQEQKVRELIIFSPRERKTNLLNLKGDEVFVSTVGKKVGIIPDAYIDTSLDLPLASVSDTMRVITMNFPAIKTNLTIFDAIGLFFSAQKASLKNQTKDEILLKDPEIQDKTVKNIFVDDAIFSENVSIQIINASNIEGLGKRLETVLSNLGCNIVAVSSARKEEKTSRIQYFIRETYTLNKLKRLLDFPIEKVEKESIADITIIIGENNTKNFLF